MRLALNVKDLPIMFISYFASSSFELMQILGNHAHFLAQEHLILQPLNKILLLVL